MTPAALLSPSPAHDLVEQAARILSLLEGDSPVSAYTERPSYPCPQCGSVVRASTPLHVEDLHYVGWTPCRVATYLNPCGHEQAAIPWPQADGRVRLIPVLRRSHLMPRVYVDLRDFITHHRGCDRPIGELDRLGDHGHHLWARCPCGARFERWLALEPAELELLRSAIDEPPR